MMRRSRLSLLLLLLLLAGCGEGTPDEEVILGEIRSVQHFELTEMELGFKERLALKEVLKKIEGTDIEKLLKEYHVI